MDVLCSIIGTYKFKEALIKSELPRYMDVPPFSMADKPSRMQNKAKSHFALFWA